MHKCEQADIMCDAIVAQAESRIPLEHRGERGARCGGMRPASATPPPPLLAMALSPLPLQVLAS